MNPEGSVKIEYAYDYKAGGDAWVAWFRVDLASPRANDGHNGVLVPHAQVTGFTNMSKKTSFGVPNAYKKAFAMVDKPGILEATVDLALKARLETVQLQNDLKALQANDPDVQLVVCPAPPPELGAWFVNSAQAVAGKPPVTDFTLREVVMKPIPQPIIPQQKAPIPPKK
jgi:hypothetical protein